LYNYRRVEEFTIIIYRRIEEFTIHKCNNCRNSREEIFLREEIKQNLNGFLTDFAI